MEDPEGLPAPLGAELTAKEEAFLRAYSESFPPDGAFGNRLDAMATAGLLPAHMLSLSEEQELITAAGRIVAKAERMSLSEVASSMGGDRIFFLHHLLRICAMDKAHEAIKGLQLLARVHGLWEKEQSLSRRQVALIFGAPVEKPEPRRANLPFVIEAEYDDLDNKTPNEG